MNCIKCVALCCGIVAFSRHLRCTSDGNANNNNNNIDNTVDKNEQQHNSNEFCSRRK